MPGSSTRPRAPTAPLPRSRPPSPTSTAPKTTNSGELMPTTTSRLSLAQPAGTDPVSEYRLAISGNASTLDAAVTYSQGTLAALPTASLAGRRYYATDIGQELYDTGSSWISVGSATPIGA